MDLKPTFSLKPSFSSNPGKSKSSLKAPKISLKPLASGKPAKLPLSGAKPALKPGLKPLIGRASNFPKKSSGLSKITLSPAPKKSSPKSSGLLKPVKTRVLDSGSNPLLNKFLSKKQEKTDDIRIKDREKREEKVEETKVSSPMETLEEAVVSDPKPETENKADKPSPATINKPLSYQEHQDLLREQNLLPVARQPLSGYLKGCFLSVVEEMNQIRDSMNSLENKLTNIEKDGFKEEQSLLLDSSWPAQKEDLQKEESWQTISGSLIPEGLTKPLVSSRENWQETSRPPQGDGTWKETIVNLKVMASTEGALQYSQKRMLGKDSGLSSIEKMVMLAELPVLETSALQASGKSRKTPFSQVEDQLRKIHSLINTHEQEYDKLEYEIISPEEENLSFTSESLSREAPPENDGEYEEGLEYSQRLLYRQLLKDLFSPLEEVQVAAAESLSRFSSGHAAQVLVKAWRKTPFNKVRSQIAKTLSVLGDEAAVTFFQKYLTHENRVYQMAALEGLYRMGTEKAVGGVIAALRSSDFHMRRRAVTYVGWLNVPTILEELHPLLKDPDDFVRRVTLNVICNLKTPARIPFLIDCLHDASLKIRRTALGALREATGQHLDFEPEASEKKRVDAIKRWKAWYKRKDLKTEGKNQMSKAAPTEELNP